MDDKNESVDARIECSDVKRLPDHEAEGHGRTKTTIDSIITVVAVVSLYAAQLILVVGAGFLGQSITADIGGRDKVTWLTLIYVLSTVVLGPMVAQIADFWGRKWLLVGSSYITVVGCIVLGRANSIGMAITGTVIAAATYACQSLIHAVPSEVLPRMYRPLAQLAVNCAVSVGCLIGIYSAGAMGRYNPHGWRNYTYMAAGFYFMAGSLIAIFYRPLPRKQQHLTVREKLRSLDFVAMVLLLVSLTALSVGLGYSNNPYPWKDAHVLAPFLLGVAGVIVLVFYSVFYQKHGLFDHDILKSRNFVISALAISVEALSFFAVNNFYGYHVGVIYGKGLWDTALIYSVTWYPQLIFAIGSGIYCSKTKSFRIPIILAFVLFAVFFTCMATTTPSTSLSNLRGYVALLGVSLGLCLPALVAVAQLSTPAQLISTATGCLLAIRALGSTVGLSVYNAIFVSALTKNLVPKVLAAVLPLGLPESSATAFVGALLANDQETLSSIPGVTSQIIGASVEAMKVAYNIGFRNVYIAAACFAVVGLIASLFLKDPKDQMTAVIDAPVKEITFLHHHLRENETTEELP